VSVDAVSQVTGPAQNVQQVTAALANAGPSLSAYRSMALRLGTQQAFAALGSAQHTFVGEVNAARFG